MRPTTLSGTSVAYHGQPYLHQIVADNNPTQYQVVGLPPGLKFDTATGLIDGIPGDSGLFHLTLIATNAAGDGPPATLTLSIYDRTSDNFAKRIPLKDAYEWSYVTNEDATSEPQEPWHAGQYGQGSLWWTWRVPESGKYQIRVQSTKQSTKPLIALYKGSALANLREVISNEGLDSAIVVFHARAGEQMQIAVDTSYGYGNEEGAMAFSLQFMGEFETTATLTVTTSEGGKVTPGFLGSTVRKLGSEYSVTAIPKPGYVFASWNGSLYSSDPKLSFRMEEDMALEAEFLPYPFTAAVGVYYGVLNSQGADGAGTIRMTVSRNGAFSATVLFERKTYNLHGALDWSGNFSATTAPGAPSPGITFVGSVDLQPGGSISGYAGSSSFSAERSSFTAQSPLRHSGRYTVLFPSEHQTFFAGTGYGTLTVSPKGAARLAGALPDGTAFSVGGVVTDSETLQVYLAPYAGTGVFAGNFWFIPSDTSDLGGSLTWVKPYTGTRSYLVNESITPKGSRYTAPAAGQRVLDFGDDTGMATFYVETGFGGNTRSILLTPANRVTTPDDPLFRLNIALQTGIFTGRVTDPVSHKLTPFGGVVVQKTASGSGLMKYDTGFEDIGAGSVPVRFNRP